MVIEAFIFKYISFYLVTFDSLSEFGLFFKILDKNARIFTFRTPTSTGKIYRKLSNLQQLVAIKKNLGRTKFEDSTDSPPNKIVLSCLPRGGGEGYTSRGVSFIKYLYILNRFLGPTNLYDDSLEC